MSEPDIIFLPQSVHVFARVLERGLFMFLIIIIIIIDLNLLILFVHNPDVFCVM
jgi:hypothetical protein